MIGAAVAKERDTPRGRLCERRVMIGVDVRSGRLRSVVSTGTAAEYSFAPLVLTGNVFVKNLWNLMKEESFQVHCAQSLLYRSRAVCDDVQNLCHECLIRCYLVVPALHKLSQHDGHKGIQLHVHIVVASQGRQELVDGRLEVPSLVHGFLRKQDLADKRLGRSIGQRVYGGRAIWPMMNGSCGANCTIGDRCRLSVSRRAGHGRQEDKGDVA